MNLITTTSIVDKLEYKNYLLRLFKIEIPENYIVYKKVIASVCVFKSFGRHYRQVGQLII